MRLFGTLLVDWSPSSTHTCTHRKTK